MKLTDKDKDLFQQAKAGLGKKKVSGGTVKEVGCALRTKDGKVFTGSSLDLWCGIGFCAEHSAIADMISHSDQTQIKTIVAVWEDRNKWDVMHPCGRCREMMQLIDKRNRTGTEVIVSKNKKVKLKELLPGTWM
jgi:cytidine deaminase